MATVKEIKETVKANVNYDFRNIRNLSEAYYDAVNYTVDDDGRTVEEEAHEERMKHKFSEEVSHYLDELVDIADLAALLLDEANRSNSELWDMIRQRLIWVEKWSSD